MERGKMAALLAMAVLAGLPAGADDVVASRSTEPVDGSVDDPGNRPPDGPADGRAGRGAAGAVARIDATLVGLMDRDRQGLAAAGADRLDRLAGAGADARYSPAAVAALPPGRGGAQHDCLTEALYFEARGEGVRGQYAVAEVILNRVDSQQFPGNVCAVVAQGTGARHACQFTYTCDGRPESVTDRAAWDRLGRIAQSMLDGAPRVLTAGATHYHTRAVDPGWAEVYPQTAAIGAHLFYRQDD